MSDGGALDHLVYATPDLGATVRELADRLGVTASPGGQHLGRGTRNCLLSLGGGSYLEIIGPDPDQPGHSGPMPFGIEGLARPCLVAWALRVTDIEARAARARAAGHDPGPVEGMERRLPDGGVLSWKLTLGRSAPPPALVPFLIHWETSPHPSETAASGVRLDGFHCETPEPDTVRVSLAGLGATLRIEIAERPRLVATLVGPGGTATLS
jgi:hypothetical protein